MGSPVTPSLARILLGEVDDSSQSGHKVNDQNLGCNAMFLNQWSVNYFGFLPRTATQRPSSSRIMSRKAAACLVRPRGGSRAPPCMSPLPVHLAHTVSGMSPLKNKMRERTRRGALPTMHPIRGAMRPPCLPCWPEERRQEVTRTRPSTSVAVLC